MADSPEAAPTGPEATADPGGGRLWELLPTALAGVFRPAVTELAAEMLREIERTIPGYAGMLHGEFGPAVADGTKQAVHAFLDRLGKPAPRQAEHNSVYYRLGRHEMRHGRSLDLLQAAYRTGARVAWRRAAEIGTRVGVPTDTLCLLAEAIFSYIDELSALSIAGHTAAKAAATGTMERRRRRLMDLILADPPAEPDTLAEFATTADWPLPERVAVVALEPTGDADDNVFPLLGDRVLTSFEDKAPCLVVPQPGVPESLLEHGLPGWRAALGPAVPLTDAAESLRCARRALTLAGSGVLPTQRMIRCDRYLVELWLFSETFPLRELISSTLAPLAALPADARERLTEALLAWLETRGNIRATAARLSVHPQTVRTRIQQLEDHFGTRLHEPRHRFDLLLALRADRALQGTAGR